MSKYALVTGAAKGIGKAIAEDLARRKFNLLLTDIDEQGLLITSALIKLQYPVSVQFVVIDLSEADAADKLFRWSAPYHELTTVVVNNAGYGLNAPFVELPIEQHLALINVNIRSLISISHAFIPVLHLQEQSWLLNVASTTAYQSVPYLNTYASSKAFALSFTRGLRKELQRSGISVSCLSPGSTDTNFVNRAGMSARTKKIADRYNMTAARVASIAVDGLFKGRAEIIPGFTNKLHAFLTPFFPKSFVESIAARVYSQRSSSTRFSKPRLLREEEDYLAAPL